MNINDTDIIVTDTIDADQIEVGDQIIVDGEPIEVTSVQDSDEDSDTIVVKGFSWDEGDSISHDLPYDYRVDVWSL